MEADTKSLLLKLRETQGKTGPNMCLASAKFVALKLSGLVENSKHLNDFLRSDWAKENADLQLKNAWGWTVPVYNPLFNEKVLPAAVCDPRAGVKAAESGFCDVEFVPFWRDVDKADRLLAKHVPLVVGVGIFGGTKVGHYITVFADSKNDVWIIDPWGTEKSSIQKLPAGFSFKKPRNLDTELGDRLPSEPAFFGYYRDPDLESLRPFPIQPGL